MRHAMTLSLESAVDASSALAGKRSRGKVVPAAGTTNTGRPDLCPPPEEAAILRPGSLDQLDQARQDAIARVRRGSPAGSRIQATMKGISA